MICSSVCVCVYVYLCSCVCVSDPAELLAELAPLLCVGFPELLLVSDQQGQFAERPNLQVFRLPPHHTTQTLRLSHQHTPRLKEEGGQREKKRQGETELIK